jgi:5'(3')-deoxyribonucleotidase
MEKAKLYVDMDNVLVNFVSALEHLSPEILEEYAGKLDEVPNIFSLMTPMEDAIESYTILAQHYDTYILSTAPWDNSSAWSDKIDWVKKYLPKVAYKRLILSHHKELNEGDFLIDDRTKNGAGEFKGELVLFGSEKYPNWKAVVKYLLSKQI